MVSNFVWEYDKITPRRWDSTSQSWINDDHQLDFQQMLEMLSFSTRFKLSQSQDKFCFVISKVVDKVLLGVGDPNDFTLANTHQLAELFLPMQLEGKGALKIFDESLHKLWCQVKSCLELSALSIDIVNDVEKMSLLLRHGLFCRHSKMKSDLKRLTSKWIDEEGPFRFGCKAKGKDFILPLKFQGSTLQESDVIDAVNDFAWNSWHKVDYYSDELWYEITGNNTNTLILGSTDAPLVQTSLSSATPSPTRVIRYGPYCQDWIRGESQGIPMSFGHSILCIYKAGFTYWQGFRRAASSSS
jgi:hypothetical protein